MKIGLLSDTHNRLTHLQAALNAFHAESITTLFHCGDLSTPETAASLGGFRVIHVIGNSDYLSGEIRRVLLELNPLSISENQFAGLIDGVSIAITHGDKHPTPEELASSGRYQYVFCGHTHHRRNELVGSTLILNPGALGGRRPEKRSACVLDLATGQFRYIFV
jgi:putative phosphoesterase